MVPAFKGKETAMNAETKNQPAAKVKVGNVQVAIWRNESDSGVFYNATVELSYRDAAGNWHNGAKSYGARELIHLAKAALLADSEIVRLKAADRAETTDEADAEAA